MSKTSHYKMQLLAGLKRFWLLGVVSLLLLGCVYIAPNKYALAGFAVFAIPIALLVNLAWALFWIRKRPFFVLGPLVIAVLAFPHIKAAFSWHKQEETRTDLKVLSFNVETFRGYSRPSPERLLAANKMIQYIGSSDADIICLQEFFDNSKSHILNALTRLKKKGYIYRYLSKSFSYDRSNQVGVVIFSKYPIIKKGTLYKRQGNNNQMIFADIVTPCDTIRVFSVHLESIRLKQEEVQAQDNGNKFRSNMASIARKMTAGFGYRGKQLEILKNHIISSPHPVILTGDFNEVPFGYLYHQLRSLLKNSFEEKGKGFGFTFNGFIPGLRIDNHFVDKSIEVTSFKTDYAMPYSDHFPLIGTYCLKPDCKPDSLKN